MNRRKSLTTLTGGTALLSALGSQMSAAQEAVAEAGGKFKHSVCHWCFGRIPLEQFCVEVKKMGIESVEILFPEQWATVAKHGLTCAMGRPRAVKGIAGIPNAFENKANHDTLVEIYEDIIPKA
ncbi:MAG: hypothetical protein PVJ98_07685, partial [Akkermansiaceae bacterium]